MSRPDSKEKHLDRSSQLGKLGTVEIEQSPARLFHGSCVLQSKEETRSAPLPGALQLPPVQEVDETAARARSEPGRELEPSVSSISAQPAPSTLPGPGVSQGSSGRAQHGSPSQAPSQMVRCVILSS